MDLNTVQIALLRWLGQEEFSQYGECHGPNLDALIAAGLAQIHGGREDQAGFIARGDSLMHRAVSLTEKGRVLLDAIGPIPEK